MPRVPARMCLCKREESTLYHEVAEGEWGHQALPSNIRKISFLMFCSPEGGNKHRLTN